MSITTLDPVERLLDNVEQGNSIIKTQTCYDTTTSQNEFYIETNNKNW